jgi:hypothetical protein
MNPDIKTEMERVDHILGELKENVRREAIVDFARTARVVRSMHMADETEQTKGKGRWNLIGTLGMGGLFSVGSYIVIANNGINIGS